MTTKITSVPLLSGATIPQLGLGTYKIVKDRGQAAIERALELGYRHLDTAQMYGNEEIVGRAIAASGLAREELFVTTKLNNGNHERDAARASFDESLEKLGLEYVDLFLIHWPLPELYGGDYPATWRVMQEFVEDGRAKTVGVSNFQVAHLQRLLDETGIAPAVNQIEMHPWFPNNEVRAWMHEHGGVVEAWSPLARGKLLGDDDALAQASERLGRSWAQLVLRWAIERGDVVIPKTVHEERMLENLAIFDFELDDEARAALDSLDMGPAGRTGANPDELNQIW